MRKLIGLAQAWAIAFLERNESLMFAFLLGAIPSFLGLMSFSKPVIAFVAVLDLVLVGVALLVKSKVPRHYILALTVHPKKSDAVMRQEMRQFCLDNGHGVLNADVRAVGGAQLAAAKDDWVSKVTIFEHEAYDLLGKSGKKMIHVFLGAPALLAFLCGITCRRVGDLHLYHYQPGKGYAPAAIWKGGTWEASVTNHEGRQTLVTVDDVSAASDICLSIEATGHPTQKGVSDLATSLSLPLIRIKLADGLGEKEAHDPIIMGLLSEQLAHQVEALQSQCHSIHMCLSAHNVVSFLMGCHIGNYQAPIKLYQEFDGEYKFLLTTKDVG